MNRVARLTFGLSLLFALAACAPAATPAAAPTSAPTAVPPVVAPTRAPLPTASAPILAPTLAPTAVPAPLFFVRPQGDAGPLIAYAMPGGAQRFSLPPGVLSADNQHYLAVQTGAASQLLAFDLTSGASAPIAQLAGPWALGGVSPNGRWAALTRLPSDSEKQTWAAANTWQTDLQVVDTHTGHSAPALKLAGNFAVDALSSAGDALFVIQYLPAVKPDHYQVRLVDLTTGFLQDGALVDKRAPDEVMAGQRWQAVAPADGSWLFTLYLRTTNNTAFVHALSTQNKFTLCFDLPTMTGNTLDQLRAYSLALSPDGQTLYAANPALGIVAKVDLNAYEVAQVASFSPDALAPAAPAPINFAVADARRLYFTGGAGLWRLDVTAHSVRSLSTLDSVINGLALSPDGGRLFAARPDQPPMMLDIVSGLAFSSQ